MYLSYYNLSEWPFQINTDPRFLWLGEKHKEALATLIYGVQDQRGFLVLTGDVGTGKTTLINALLEKLDVSVLVGNITDPKLDMIGFLNAVAASFGGLEKTARKEVFLDRFSKFLNEKYAENKLVLLIIDEAHTLSADHLEQIRLLSNIELPERKLISIFLVGQDELNTTLTSHECRALRQRITLICRVGPLSEEETGEYIRHRLRIAGTERQIFSRAAVREIQQFSRGYPRLINILCDHALLTGYVRESRRITPNIIKDCYREMLLPGERIESPHAPAKDLEPPSSAPSVEQLEEVETKRLRESTGRERESHARVPALFSRLKAKSPFFWVMWACPVLLISLLTFLSRTDLFSGIDRQEAAMSTSVPAVQPTPSEPATVPAGVEPGALRDEAPETRAAAVPPSVAQEYHPESEPPEYIADAGTENPPGGETMPGTGEKNALESVEDAFQSRDFTRAIELSEKIMESSALPPRLKALYLEALLNQAEALWGTDAAASETLLKRAASFEPRNLKALLLLGKFHTQQKDYGKALEAYQKAADLNPNLPGLFFNLGFLYAAVDDYALAESSFARAIELSPPYLDQALFNLAVVQDKQGKRDASLQSLRKAMEINPENQKVRDLLERIVAGSGGRS